MGANTDPDPFSLFLSREKASDSRMAADLASSDYYENLGVARSATEQEIKTAYVGLAVAAAARVKSAGMLAFDVMKRRVA